MLTPRADIKQSRRQHKLSQKQLGNLVGCHAQTIDKIERGQITFSRFLLPIEARLGLHSTTDLNATAVTTKLRQPPSPVDKLYGTIAAPVRVDLPLFRSAAASLRASEMFVTAKAVKMTHRPLRLNDVEDAYGLTVGCDCMAPAFEVGDEAFVDPTLPPAPGKDVLLRASLIEDGAAVIGRLETYSDKDWEIVQWNSGSKPASPKKLTLPRTEFPFCHRVVGKWSR